MKILYVNDGACSGTALHRLQALRDIGHQADLLPCDLPLFQKKILRVWNVRSGYLFFSNILHKKIRESCKNRMWDLVWVNGGATVSKAAVKTLSRHSRGVINYNFDDPFGGSEFQKWRLFLSAVPCYSLLVVVRDFNIGEAKMHGAKNVIRETFGYDKLVHRPPAYAPVAREKHKTIVFVGSWKSERGKLISDLLDIGIPVRVFGPGWNKDRYWEKIKSIVDNRLQEDAEYVSIIQQARGAICLVSKGNRDQCTTRSFEIPAIGTPMIAEKTEEHLRLYGENQGVLLWSNAKQCAEHCIQILKDPSFAEECALKASGRLRELGAENREIANRILDTASRLAGNPVLR